MTPGLTVQTPRGPFTLARSCDGCTLCCRVLEAATLDKPMGVLCRHCLVDSGCGIHETRPDECRNYHCGWLIDANLGEEWRPETAHIIITYDLDGRRLNANADPEYPDAWRAEPYYSQLKAWAAFALPRNGQIVAQVGRHVHVMLPHGHEDIGVMSDDEYIFIERLADDRWAARKVDEDEAKLLAAAGTSN